MQPATPLRNKAANQSMHRMGATLGELKPCCESGQVFRVAALLPALIGDLWRSAAFACMKHQVTNSILAKRIGFFVLVLFMLPVLYVLSIGPAVRLFRARVLPEEFVRFWEPIR